MATLLSVNIGSPQALAGSATPTGIVKLPRTGPVMIDEMGLLGDAVLDKKHHGGRDQAVYIYMQSDYDWWAGELGQPFPPGTFGENLTIGGLSGDTLAIGDRIQIGDVLLEVTYHRTPCATLGRKMGDPRWVKRFARALRPGAYMRVLVPGTVEAGMDVSCVPFAGERVTVTELMATDGMRERPRELMERVLRTPIREKTRLRYEPLLRP
ncbi:MAG: MOSC domain-containing protein [Hyphomicrobiales bacterium]|nr:MAG: MOSC domain-containing protein [Hyphomicrobiales bacterium]